MTERMWVRRRCRRTWGSWSWQAQWDGDNEMGRAIFADSCSWNSTNCFRWHLLTPAMAKRTHWTCSQHGPTNQEAAPCQEEEDEEVPQPRPFRKQRQCVLWPQLVIWKILHVFCFSQWKKNQWVLMIKRPLKTFFFIVKISLYILILCIYGMIWSCWTDLMQWKWKIYLFRFYLYFRSIFRFYYTFMRGIIQKV